MSVESVKSLNKWLYNNGLRKYFIKGSQAKAIDQLQEHHGYTLAEATNHVGNKIITKTFDDTFYFTEDKVYQPNEVNNRDLGL